MERLYASGRLVFAAAMASLGVENFVCAHSQGEILQVLPWMPASPALAYLTGAALAAAGFCIAFDFRPRAAAMLLGALLLGCMVVLQLPKVVQQPFDLGIRTTFCELLALGAAAWTLAERLPAPQPPRGKSPVVLDRVLRSGRYLFATAAVVFGISHLLIPQFIASLIPPWFPGALFWAYFTGVGLIAAGLSIAARRMDRLAASLLGSMFLLWFLFLHIPRLTSAPRSHDPDEWSSAFIALAMCGASWLMLRVARGLRQTAPQGAPDTRVHHGQAASLSD